MVEDTLVMVFMALLVAEVVVHGALVVAADTLVDQVTIQMVQVHLVTMITAAAVGAVVAVEAAMQRRS